MNNEWALLASELWVEKSQLCLMKDESVMAYLIFDYAGGLDGFVNRYNQQMSKAVGEMWVWEDVSVEDVQTYLVFS